MEDDIIKFQKYDALYRLGMFDVFEIKYSDQIYEMNSDYVEIELHLRIYRNGFLNSIIFHKIGTKIGTQN